jgi:hypothetical protein
MSAEGFEISGVMEMELKIKVVGEEMREALRRALDAVLITMANFIKENKSNWKDQTGNLRNSINITGAEESIPEYRASEKPKALPPLRNAGAQWTAEGALVGILYAGMEYALYVELKEGHWVISGAFAEYEDKVLDMIAEFMKEQGF